MIGKIILLHAIGDYLLQWEELAVKKKSSSFHAALHAFLYTVPFVILTRSPLALFVIFFTHFLIDRYSIVSKINKIFWKSKEKWLDVVRDNIIHIIIDYLAITYL